MLPDPTTDIKIVRTHSLSEGISCIAQDIPSDTAPEGHKGFALDLPRGLRLRFAIPLETLFYRVREEVCTAFTGAYAVGDSECNLARHCAFQTSQD